MRREDRQLVTLAQCAEMLTGFAFASEQYVSPSNAAVRLLRGDNITPGALRWDDAKYFPSQKDAKFARYELRAGDVVLALDRPIIGSGLKCSVVKPHDLPCLLVQRVARLRATDRIDQGYLAQIVQTQQFISHLVSKKTETAVPHISPTDIREYAFLLPGLEEQRRTSEVLRTWDDAISITEKSLASSRKQKQMLMRLLLTRQRHHVAHTDAWQNVDFDTIFERITRKNSVDNQNVLTISGQYGLVGQREFFNKHVASENLRTYALLNRFDFAYNKSYSAGYPMGAIKPLMSHDSGVVSSLYICFRIRSDVDASHDFFRHYFEAGLLNEQLSGIAQEGARNHGLLNVSVTDFFKLRLHVPPAPVQRKIAEIINVAEAQEQSIAQQLRHLQTEKRALMKQLLSGRRRLGQASIAG